MHTFDSLCRYPKRKNVSLSNPLTWIRRALLSQGVGPRNPLAKNRILRSVNRIAKKGERERWRHAKRHLRLPCAPGAGQGGGKSASACASGFPPPHPPPQPGGGGRGPAPRAPALGGFWHPPPPGCVP